MQSLLTHGSYCINGELDRPYLFERGFGKNTGPGLFLSKEILSITGISICETGLLGTGAQFEIAVPEGAFRFTEEPAPL